MLYATQKQQGAPQSSFLVEKASLTVEAALAFPLIFFALYSMLFLFCVLQTIVGTKGALAATGSRLSLELTEEKGSAGREVLYFYQEMKEKGASTQWIAGKWMGIRWLGTKTEGERVKLCIQYDCKLPVPVFGIRTIPIAQQVQAHKWIGRGGAGASQQDGDDTWVYVTPQGSVYHKSRECTHLQLSIQAVNGQQAKESYSPCQKCGNEKARLSYYVTNEGNRYHTSLRCSGLKRTIFLKRLSELAGYRGCSRCGG